MKGLKKRADAAALDFVEIRKEVLEIVKIYAATDSADAKLIPDLYRNTLVAIIESYEEASNDRGTPS